MKRVRHTAPSHTDHFFPQGGRCRVVMVFMNILVSVSCLGISGVHGFHHSFTAQVNFSWSNSLHVVEIQPGFEVSKVNFDSRILSSTLANCFTIYMVWQNGEIIVNFVAKAANFVQFMAYGKILFIDLNGSRFIFNHHDIPAWKRGRRKIFVITRIYIVFSIS